MVPGAIGSQTNGSVIRPAAFCGVVGFKPTHGLIPRSGALLLSRALDHVGVFARSVADAALLAEVMAGLDEDDPDTRAIARPPLAEVAVSAPPLPPRVTLTVGTVLVNVRPNSTTTTNGRDNEPSGVESSPFEGSAPEAVISACARAPPLSARSRYLSMKASALIGRGSGEAFQLGFAGQGFVVVQPSENPMRGGGAQGGGSGGMLGRLGG